MTPSKKDWPINGGRKNLSFLDQPQTSKPLVRNIISRKQNTGITEGVTSHTHTTAHELARTHASTQCSSPLVPIHLIATAVTYFQYCRQTYISHTRKRAELSNSQPPSMRRCICFQNVVKKLSSPQCLSTPVTLLVTTITSGFTKRHPVSNTYSSFRC